jgi:hypothetical protein
MKRPCTKTRQVRPGELFGSRCSDDLGTAWTDWALLDRRHLSRAEVRAVIQDFIDGDNYRPRQEAGGYFSRATRFRRVGPRILLTRFAGYDV